MCLQNTEPRLQPQSPHLCLLLQPVQWVRVPVTRLTFSYTSSFTHSCCFNLEWDLLRVVINLSKLTSHAVPTREETVSEFCVWDPVFPLHGIDRSASRTRLYAQLARHWLWLFAKWLALLARHWLGLFAKWLAQLAPRTPLAMVVCRVTGTVSTLFSQLLA